jgi:hypothetical protein
MDRRIAFGWLAGASLILAGCDWATAPARPHVLRYKLTATVSTPSGERSGHSVIEVALSRTARKFDVRGEAVAVDLPDGQTLFVLLRSPTEADWAAWTLNAVPTPERDVQVKGSKERIAQIDRWVEYLKTDRGVHPIWTPEPPHNVPGLSVPYMVRFRDISDPQSVELADPNNLGATFGSGYSLKSLTLQMTIEPVTSSNKNRLPWLEAVGRQRATLIPVRRYDINEPKVTSLKAKQKISPTDFSTEIYK